MDDVIESVKSGGSIAAPLKDAPIFPSMVAQMIAVGEETGNLDTMLTKVADFYEDEVAAAVKALTSILEPVMIILVGGIVGFIVDRDVHADVQGLRRDQVGGHWLRSRNRGALRGASRRSGPLRSLSRR